MTAWFPLREAAICIDCAAVWHYQFNAPACPACGSRQFRFLAVWLDRKGRAA